MSRAQVNPGAQSADRGTPTLLGRSRGAEAVEAIFRSTPEIPRRRWYESFSIEAVAARSVERQRMRPFAARVGTKAAKAGSAQRGLD
jgi:hypothetical protein